ncbi:hypothetical protein GCM10011369_32780 [Neiella marina]|uniref:Short-chain dehydrogenase n=1 Tax=Neiella marina TaxID=508461 RepID=A0A8J2XR82_9GAMM|nr:SDR family oxidoreductase [Neiella marina]GGA88113.1 hypothetical protein GCM10011369_32780 [Neiella marina]
MHILLTGASSGIGRALAVALDAAGHQLSLCGRNPEKLQQTLDQLAHPERHLVRAFCLSDFDAIAEFASSAQERGAVDVLINCAGLNHARGAGHELPKQELDWMLTINCHAPIAMMRAVVPDMLARASGMIVNVLSTVCLFANPNLAGYTASKAALDAYCKVMRKELQPQGVQMLSVYPGGVDTDFRSQQRPEYLSPAQVAEAIVPHLSTKAHVHELVLRPQCESNYS